MFSLDYVKRNRRMEIKKIKDLNNNNATSESKENIRVKDKY